ncbi:MAG: hypothetical protein BZY73_04220 [SAR202 cluster bacterium Casp-Chloro-G3]|nr:MAG: hypothetical protein BZY73_04220 [SAR202 cluster bacterium Casp-Chloro-G3]
MRFRVVEIVGSGAPAGVGACVVPVAKLAVLVGVIEGIVPLLQATINIIETADIKMDKVPDHIVANSNSKSRGYRPVDKSDHAVVFIPERGATYRYSS